MRTGLGMDIRFRIDCLMRYIPLKLEENLRKKFKKYLDSSGNPPTVNEYLRLVEISEKTSEI